MNISYITKKILQEKPFIHEALEKDLVNVVALAELIKPDIERELGEVKTSAISMAIRRYMDKEKKAFYNKVTLTRKSDLVIKSNLFELSVLKSAAIYKKLIQLYNIVNFDVGDTLNIIHGNYEILIVSNDKYKDKFLDVLDGESVKSVKENMASISIKIPKDFIDKPGFYYAITKILTMQNISIADIVNTETEATFVVEDKFVSKAYNALKAEMSVEYYKK
ncbi:MAG: hypothetical protein AABW92_03515 [Nanoarchaeota archaeon]